jgi:hypothetical protein
MRHNLPGPNSVQCSTGWASYLRRRSKAPSIHTGMNQNQCHNCHKSIHMSQIQQSMYVRIYTSLLASWANDFISNLSKTILVSREVHTQYKFDHDSRSSVFTFLSACMHTIASPSYFLLNWISGRIKAAACLGVIMGIHYGHNEAESYTPYTAIRATQCHAHAGIKGMWLVTLMLTTILRKLSQTIISTVQYFLQEIPSRRMRVVGSHYDTSKHWFPHQRYYNNISMLITGVACMGGHNNSRKFMWWPAAD